MNAAEIQAIVDDLFIGNKLAAGRVRTSDGTSIDLRNIRSPIVVFCSKGDNVTPPQQALDWILDLYEDVDEIRSYGQTIVYMIHETIGHLGIFVSGGVAKKEHGEFSSNIDLIDTLPPGLYEAVLTDKTGDMANPDLISGKWLMRFETRTLDDIRALGANDAADERRFETAARVSEINLSLYRTFAQPFMRAVVNQATAEWMRRLHPLRLQYEIFSNANPMMNRLAGLAAKVRENRKPVAADNAFLAVQEAVSNGIVAGLDAWRNIVEMLSEKLFLDLYGSPALQAAVGVDRTSSRPLRRAPRSLLHRELLRTRFAELKSRTSAGGLREAVIRSVLYVGMTRGAVDERGFELARRIRDVNGELALSEFKAIVRDQFFMLLLDEDAALRSIPSMVASSPQLRQQAFDLVTTLLSARGAIAAEEQSRLKKIADLFEPEKGRRALRSVS